MSRVYPLQDDQRLAVDPQETVWLSASAGTGKTQVLSARVLRLLLQDGVAPGQILCLTFTKAGAAEMATRVNEVLASWVRMPETELALQLGHIGAPIDKATLDRARTLFAAVLDCPGGGLRINTIHAFAQWLLAGFPEEAGLAPGTRAMEDRDRVLLSREVLADLLVAAENSGDDLLLAALARLSRRMAPEDVERFLMRCAECREAWFGPGSWVPPLRDRVERLLGLPAGATLAELCTDAAFDLRSLRHCMDVNAGWKAATGQKTANAIGDWLALDPEARGAGLADLAGHFLKQDGDPKSTKNLDKIDPAYADHAARVIASIRAAQERAAMLALVEWLTPALELGRRFALAWDEAKRREGLIDFDDQIRQAADLLGRSELAQWIRYKLDRRFDHILIDEAQDTNAAQWEIIGALTGDFFAGIGQRAPEVLRTLFVVGDYKQAIFRFQGTSPDNFERARREVRRQMTGLAENVERLRGAESPRTLRELGLGRSYRTARPILAFVDAAIAAIGPGRFGLEQPPEPHVGEARPGQVLLWPPAGGEDDEAAEPREEGEETWLSRPDRQLADRLARQIADWLDPRRPGYPLHKGGHRRAAAGDIMILVRKRKELAGLIVARLHAHGVPVAGVDRLRLGAPLAVKDLVAAVRFAAQPLDDLNLAALLVSPLLGWSQDDLLKHGYRPAGVPLWEHLRRSRDARVTATVDQLVALLGRADYELPQALLHWLLVGPWQARRKLVARLGREANDPLDELLNAAHGYGTSETASLTGFLHWFDAGDGELKREAEGAGGLVRVMTVHGSKGLQAPIVILADAADDPDTSKGPPLELSEPRPAGLAEVYHPAARIPLPTLRKSESLGRIAEAAAEARAEEREEHWRLLYVAMTRAEEALFVTGSLATRETEPAADSWFARLAEVAAEVAPERDPLWGSRIVWGTPPEPAPPAAPQSLELDLPAPLPAWLMRPVGAEPRPPRPLAPSALGEDDSADPPYPPGAGGDAARRGTLIHRLLERLPETPLADRADQAARWLARHGADLAEPARAEIVDAALRVLGEPRWAELFAPGALAEVPIAATVSGRVIAGTIDRLVVTAERVRLVDFKTTRRPPATLAEVPTAMLRQMAAYAAALEVTFPDRSVEVALLFTQTPVLLDIPPEVLTAHKPVFGPGD
ncbi:double-strand break repair helicase AddA [Novosphingobium piscinae]|uniref:DNA 3'-5' helicase n=1 Tax=Novosphingobium piscinae TaxID=1507448 RepID=A0A7X1G0Y5_9SPHN|nr:double-strand break repair helicase AddA [Novosphingobium piscinae]MBC2670653.1 double-strand break repair helicase AddA [Novosphingobium piscinae]